jgi:hypothetical protein
MDAHGAVFENAGSEPNKKGRMLPRWPKPNLNSVSDA